VDASRLHIEGFADDATLRTQPRVSRSDEEIGQALLDAYVRDPRVAPFVPSVNVRQGVVVLTGVAPNPDAARAAGDDARNVTGVIGVHDDIKGAPTLLSEPDARVRSEVQTAIARDQRLASLHIGVEVLRGRVILRGTVPSEPDRLHAIALASSAAGARDVEDGLVLAPTLGVTSRQPQGR
jgi:osmotically-inducible protein OsmY